MKRFLMATVGTALILAPMAVPAVAFAQERRDRSERPDGRGADRQDRQNDAFRRQQERGQVGRPGQWAADQNAREQRQVQERGARDQQAREHQAQRQQAQQQQAQPQPAQPQPRREQQGRDQRPRDQQVRGEGRRDDRRIDQRDDRRSNDRVDRQGDRRWDGPRQDNRQNDRRGDDRRWSDQRGDNRPGARGDRSRWAQSGYFGRGSRWQSDRRYRISAYRAPYGYAWTRWSFGQILPSAFYSDSYVLRDFWNYDLPEPPPWAVWVRSGPDALLVERDSGYVIEVVQDLFW